MNNFGNTQNPSQRLTITITPTGNIDGYIPGSDMAKIWGVSRDTIRMWVHRGKLSFPDCIRLGTREYFIKLGTQKPEEKKTRS